MTDQPRLAIVTGTFNRLRQIRDCVDSIKAQTRIPFVLYVSDAGSTDGTVEYLRSVASDTVVPIFEGERVGQAKAYNSVFRQIQTPYTCWISDDNIIVDGGLDKAVSVLEDRSCIGMLGLKVRDIKGPFEKSPYIGGISEAGILNVNQGMLPTPLLQRVGGFSEVFRNYGIDPDLTAKILYSGYEVAYTRDVVIHHQRNWSEDPASEEFQALSAMHDRSRRLYLAKYGSWDTKGPIARFKAALFRLAQRRWRLPSVNSQELYCGALARDWFNIAHSRYISMWDTQRYKGQAFHLVQRCPRSQLPTHLPDDSDLEAHEKRESIAA